MRLKIKVAVVLNGEETRSMVDCLIAAERAGAIETGKHQKMIDEFVRLNAHAQSVIEHGASKE